MFNHLKTQFIEPLDEFTPIPFWFWNDTLDEAEISRQIHDFKEKGVMGFVIHPRIGIPKDIPYLSDSFMHFVKHAVSEAAQLGMKVVLYDEAMYPSGSAHGMVVKANPDYATKSLRMIDYPCEGTCEIIPEIQDYEQIISVQAAYYLDEHTIHLDSITPLHLQEGKICFNPPTTDSWHVLCFIQSFTGGTIRGIHFGEDDKEPDAPPSGDLMNPEAMDKFIELTYERYYDVLKEYFGNTIIAMFTDEPDVKGRCCQKGHMPWTTDFLDWYQAHEGNECDLPLLWFDAGEASSAVRKTFKKAVNRRLEYAYYGKISEWCQAHNIALTGHPHGSDDIGFLKYFQIPGQDIVWRWVAPEDDKGIEGTHSTMGKCSSDAARHMGRRRNSNECFGCCGPDGVHWAFTADDMKWYMDWLFVRGVNLLYPHAFYYSIDGEKRSGERPPDVGPNNTWWKYYKQFSSYIKRMSWLMTDSINTTPIAMLCEEDHLPWAMPKHLFQNQIEFNYLENNLLLSDACIISDGTIHIQKQKYNVLLVETPELLDQTLSEKLNAFIATGGKVVVYNESKSPLLLNDAIEINHLNILSDTLDRIMERDAFILPAHQDLRISHVIKENMHFYLLVNEGDTTITGNLYLSTHGHVELWNPWQGTSMPANHISFKDNLIVSPITLARRESTIMCINPSLKVQVNNTIQTEQHTPLQVSLNNTWNIWNFSEFQIPITNLNSWTEWPNMEHFTGTVTYYVDFTLDSLQEIQNLVLDLGKVHEIAHLYINDRDAGYKLWAPYTFDITPYIKQGTNTIKLEVTNTPTNKLCQLSLPSGLLGPVTLTQYI